MLKPPYILMKDNYNVLRIWAQNDEEHPDDQGPQSIAAVCSDGGTSAEEDQAHGEFICMACNAHHNLIELIDNLTPVLELDKEILQSTRTTLALILEKARVQK